MLETTPTPTKKQDLYRACVAAGIHGKKLGVYDAFAYD